jgi:hypothetical protein
MRYRVFGCASRAVDFTAVRPSGIAPAVRGLPLIENREKPRPTLKNRGWAPADPRIDLILSGQKADLSLEFEAYDNPCSAADVNGNAVVNKRSDERHYHGADVRSGPRSFEQRL